MHALIHFICIVDQTLVPSHKVLLNWVSSLGDGAGWE